MADLTHTEEAWLRYAHTLADDQEHLDACKDLGGSPDGPEFDPNHTLDPDLRWPGYLGRDYSSGRVLCVATVHRDFETNGAGTQVRADIVDATRGLRDRTISDGDYLASVRRGYEAGLLKWIVGGNLGVALGALDVPLTAIAYVNAARCQYPEDRDHLPDKAAKQAAKAAGDKVKAAVLKLCWTAYPITRLVEILDPRVVVFANAPTFDRAKPDLDRRGGVAAVCIHQWQQPAGSLLRPLQVGDLIHPRKTPLSSWTPTVRELLGSEGMR
jgi:hypothetical protein